MNQQLTERQAIENISVGRVMHRGVLTCPTETPLRTVARMMAARRVHAVVVFDEISDDVENTQLWGVVSDLDLVKAANAFGIDDRTAGGIAVTPVVMVEEHDTLAHAVQLMSEHEITHLVVADLSTQRAVGIISTLDVARALADTT